MAARRLVRVARGLRRSVEGLLLTAVFVVALAVGVLMHIDVPAGRRIAARTLTGALGRLFQGDVQIGGVEHIDLYSLVATDVDVHDPDGKQVLHVTRLSAKADLSTIVYDLLFAKDKVNIVIRYVRVEDAEGLIVPDAHGIPTIARAFALRAQPAQAPSKPSAAPARYIRVWLPEIEVGKAFARGTVAGLPMMETQLASVKGSILVTPKGVALDVERFGTVLRGLGGADARGTGMLHVRAPGAIWTGFDGYFGDVQVGAFARVDGKRLSVNVDLPRAAPGAVRALFPAYPLREDVAAHVEAVGELPVLQTTARFDVGQAHIFAKGPLHLSGTVGVDLDVHAEDLDLRALLADAPATRISADTSLSIWNKHGQVVVDVNGTTEPGEIAQQDVPAVDVTGSYNESGFKGKATLHERGLPLKVDFVIHPDGAVDLDARARTFSLQGAPRVARYTRASGLADVRVVAHIAESRLDANVTGDFKGFALGDVRLGSTHLAGHASGPLGRPIDLAIDARVSGKELSAGLFSFGRFHAHAVGPVRHPRVETLLEDDFGPKVTASGVVTTTGKPSVQDLAVEIARDQATLRGKVARLDLGTGSVDIDKLHVEGAGGELDGSARIRPDLVEVTASGHDLDLDVIARAIGLPRGVMGGKFRVDADVIASRELTRGKVRVALGNGSIMGVEGISLDLYADLQGTTFNGGASVLLRDIGAFGAQWETRLAGPIQKAESWRDIVGRSELQMSGVTLDGVERLLPASLRIEKIQGQAAGKLTLERRVPGVVPSASVLMETHGLQVTRAAADGDDKQALRITGVDVQVGGKLDGETGATAVTTRLVYENTALAIATSTLTLDMHELVAHPDQIASQLAGTPIDAVIMVDDRDFVAFPAPLRPAGIAGSFGGRVTVSGKPTEPVIGATIDAHRIMAMGARYTAPVDVHATAQYERSTGHFGGNAEAYVSGQRVGLLSAHGDARWEDLFAAGALDHPRWTGGGQIIFERMPLAIFGALADAHIGGELNGTLAMERTGLLPQIAANVQVGGVSIDRTPVGLGHLLVRSDGERISAGLAFEKGNGKLAATARAALVWDGLLPRIDQARPVVLGVDATGFDAIVLQPLLSDVLSELSGAVDAHLSATLQARPATADAPDADVEWGADISGTARMHDGVLQLAALGLELTDVGFNATASRVGKFTRIQIDDVTANARSDKPNLDGSATLFLDGLRVVNGTARLAADAAAPVPVLVQGVTLATVDTGKPTDANRYVKMTLKREPDRMLVAVEVPNLVAQLPRAQTRDVQPLGENPDIQVVQPLSEPTTKRSSTALPWRIAFSLGNVRLTRNDVEVPVGGEPVIDIGTEAGMGGYVTLKPGGRVPAMGRVFAMEGGRVTFDTGEAGNPHVDITASWRSPEGTTVYAIIQGKYKEATIRLTSDPPLPEAQITALLLGGPDTSGQGGSGPSGGALASGAASQLGLYDLLADTPLSNVQFSAGSRENQYGNSNTAYTAAVRVSDKVWIEGTYEQAGGVEKSDPNTAAPAFSAAFDWRFRRNWSLRTELGTATTALDLLWYYRY